MLYGVETKAPESKHVKKMQTLINGYERRLALGPSGGTKDMVGKYTQADIKVLLGTLSIQLEIDIRILRYVGHIARLPCDRWEYRVLFGRLRGTNDTIISKGKDNWWEHLRKLIKELMNVVHSLRNQMEIEDNLPWFEIAKNRAKWRSYLHEWIHSRIKPKHGLDKS